MSAGKKIAIAAVCLAVAGGGLYGFMKYNDSKKVVDVVPVSAINETVFEESVPSEGYVVSADSQEIYLDSSQDVKEVNVSEGQEVKKGDVLITLDTTTSELALESKKLSIAQSEMDYKKLTDELNELRNTTPVYETFAESEEGQEYYSSQESVQPDTSNSYSAPEQDNEAWLELRDFEQEHAREPIYRDSSEETVVGYQYSFLVSRDAKVYGSFFQSLASQNLESGDVVRLVTSSNDGWDGYITPVWQVDTSFSQLASNGIWDVNGNYLDTEEETAPVSENESPADGETLPEEGPADSSQSYTEAELKAAITEKEKQIRALDVSIRKQRIELQKLEKEMTDGAIVAKKDGIVTKVMPVQDSESNEPFIVISGSKGVFIEGTISELMMDKVNVGQYITATTFENGTEVKAKIEEIEPWPAENQAFYSSGNPNVSYYTFTAAVVEGDENLKTGDYVQFKFDAETKEADEMNIVIPKSYVRKENGRNYVMKDYYGVLKKQYVQTGQIYYGYQIEILSGITLEDALAFPYGQNVKEGVKTQLNQESEVAY